MKDKKAVIERNVNREEFFSSFLTLISVNNPEKRLTDTEKLILIKFMLLSEPKFYYNRFSSIARKRIREEMGVGHTYVNNYIDSLKKKGYLRVDQDNILGLAPSLNKILDAKNLELTFKFNINE